MCLVYAFFAVPFQPVAPPPDWPALLAAQRAKYDYELLGYQLLLAAPEADAVMQAHVRLSYHPLSISC